MRPSINLLTLLLILLALPAANVRAAESYDGCAGYIDTVPAVISTQGVWCLRQDLSTAIESGFAIVVATNNVTIDCNDFKLGGLAAGADTTATGIGALASRLNFTVRNCNIRGFQRGIEFNFPDSGGGLVEDNRLEGNTLVAISLNGDGTIVRRNRISDTGGSPSANAVRGIQLLSASSGGRIEENSIVNLFSSESNANASPAGILLDGDANIVRGNFVSGIVPNGTGTARGVLIFGASNILEGNYFINRPATAGNGISSTSANSCVNNRALGFNTSAISSCADGGGNLEL